MATQPAYLLQGKNIIIVIDNKSHTISKDTHMNYGKIVDALKARNWESLRDLVDPKTAIVNFGKGNVAIEGGNILWKGVALHNALTKRMLEMYTDGFPIEPMSLFMENLMKNPSKRSVDQLYGFLEKNNLPITEDGHFLAYKKVSKSYKDIHTGKISNDIGAVVEMERNLVDDNPDSTCSSGLHFCSEAYLKSFGNSDDPIMILKINPADVVSIPADYDGAKGRCNRYEVTAQVKGDPKTAFSSVVDTTYAPSTAWTLADTPVYAKTPAKELRGVTTSNWPFPGTTPATWPPKQTQPTNSATYMVVRISDGTVRFNGLTLQVAKDKVAKAASQKKAKLQVVDPNGVVVK